MIKIALCMPVGSGSIPVETVTSLINLRKPNGFDIDYIFISQEPIEKARNDMICEVYNRGYDYMLMMDDDNPVGEDTLLQLLDANADIATAIIPSRHGKNPLTIFKMDNNILRNINRRELKSHPFEIDACGCGCFLMNKKAIKDIVERYAYNPFQFKYIIKEGNNEIDIDNEDVGGKDINITYQSESITFFNRCKSLGYKIMAVPGIEVYHMGNKEKIR